MNASSILKQLMSQASSMQSGSSSKQDSKSPGFDVNSIVSGLAGQFGGGGSSGSKSTGGFDVKSLLGGGALGILTGSKRSRGMGTKVLKYGALAGAGALAWKAYQNYQANNAQTQSAGGQSFSQNQQQGSPVEQLSGPDKERRGQEILQAMIMAARADGHIDAVEQAQLAGAIEKLGADEKLQRWVQSQFTAPLDAKTLAAKSDSPQAAREMYLVSAAMVDEQNPMERAWLDQLGNALSLDAGLCAEIERQVLAAE